MTNQEIGGCVVLMVIIGGLLWCIGCVGNQSGWMNQNCSSPKVAYASAKKAVENQWKERRAAVSRKRAERALLAEEKKREIVKERECAQQEMAEKEKMAEIARRKAHRESVLRGFAEKESPVLWRSVVAMRNDIREQDLRIERLENTLREMGEDPLVDTDCIELRRQRERLQERHDEVMAKIKTAYIKSMKYEASIGRKELEEFRCNAEDHGAVEADAAGVRYEQMRREK